MAAATHPAPALTIRERVAAQGARIKRVKLLDRLAVGFITFGGIFIIVAVSFIFVFILGEALPLFRPAQGEARGLLNPAAVPVPPEATTPAVPLEVGSDEYQLYVYELLDDGRVAFFKGSDGSFARDFPPPALRGAG